MACSAKASASGKAMFCIAAMAYLPRRRATGDISPSRATSASTGIQILERHDIIGDADLGGAGGVDQFAGQAHFVDVPGADHLAQIDQTCMRNTPTFASAVRSALIGDHDQIAQRHQSHAARHAIAVDTPDDRDADVAHQAGELAEIGHRLIETEGEVPVPPVRSAPAQNAFGRRRSARWRGSPGRLRARPSRLRCRRSLPC